MEKEKSRLELEKVSKGVGFVGLGKEGPTKLLFLRPYQPIGRQEYGVQGHLSASILAIGGGLPLPFVCLIIYEYIIQSLFFVLQSNFDYSLYIN